MTFSRTEACLTVLGSKTLDSDLGIVYFKTGLDIATADKFAKTNKIKTIDKDKKEESNTNKNIRNNVKTQQTYQFAISRGNPWKQVISQSTTGCCSLERNY